MGFNLPELMISLAIGMVLLAAFLKVLDRCRSELTAIESLGRLHDGARHVLSVLTSDLEHAGFYGQPYSSLQLTRGGNVVATSADMRQPFLNLVPPVSDLPGGSHDCGVNFAVDLGLVVQAANNAFPTGIGARDCEPTAAAGGVRTGSDSLTVRHAALSTAPSHPGRLQLLIRLLDSHGALTIFGDGRPPEPVDEHTEIRDLEVHTYYIANNSTGRRDWPALRMKGLTESRGAAQFRDEEILPGVEDLQVEFGVREESAASAIRFVPPDDGATHTARIVAVRLWLRLRADVTERGYRDARTLEYSDVRFTPDAREAAQRRVLVERTVALRNGP